MSNNLLYYLNTTLQSGQQAWYIVSLQSQIKLRLLESYVRKNTSYDVRDLGEILYGGYGEAAPQEVLDAVNAEFGTAFAN